MNRWETSLTDEPSLMIGWATAQPTNGAVTSNVMTQLAVADGPAMVENPPERRKLGRSGSINHFMTAPTGRRAVAKNRGATSSNGSAHIVKKCIYLVECSTAPSGLHGETWLLNEPR